MSAQPNRCSEKCRRDDQADPETGCAQEFSRSEARQRVDRGVAGTPEGDGKESYEAACYDAREIRSAERNLLEDLDHD